MPIIRGRIRRRGQAAEPGEERQFELDATELGGLFAAPRWLRDAGFTAWLLVGVTLLTVGTVWLLSLTEVIFIPVVTAALVAAVAGQLVTLLQRHRVPRAAGTLIVLVLILVVGAVAAYLVLHGIASESGAISSRLETGAATIEGWLVDIGVDQGQARKANHDVSAGSSDAFETLVHGLGGALAALSSLAFFLAMVTLSLFFLLKDGPQIRAWAEAHTGIPQPVAHMIGDRTLQSLRGYFLGVTIVAAFNALLVGVGALLLGVPLAGTIAVVTFIGGYIPYVGAWSAGVFSVLLALGGAGPEAASGMIGIQILANGPLQQIVQPVAYGAALGIHPLPTLIVTIAGGALFGAVGLILAAPITAAAVRVSADLARARSEAETRAEGSASDPPAARTVAGAGP